MIDQFYEPYIGLGKTPISIESPCGENYRLEEIFEGVEKELAKLDSLTNQSPIDWKRILESSRLILADYSKDIILVSYLSRALYELKSLDGLAIGLQIMADLVETYWEDCFPPKKRMRGRSGAFEWLFSRLSTVFETITIDASNVETFKSLSASITVLDNDLYEKMGEDAPALGEIKRKFRDDIQRYEYDAKENAVATNPTPAPTPNVVPASVSNEVDKSPNNTSTQPVQTPAQTTTAVVKPQINTPIAANVGSDADIVKVILGCKDALIQISDYSLRSNYQNPLGYRINRMITWLQVDQLPQHVDGKTPLRSIPKDKIFQYEQQKNAAEWANFLPDIEKSLARSPFWLTGHRLVFEALNQINADKALHAVKHAVREFVERLPEIVNLTFQDGLPFADDATKIWIEEYILTSEGGDESDSTPSNQLDFFKEAKALVKAGSLVDGIKFLQLQQTVSARQKFCMQLMQAKLCMHNQQYHLATPVFESLEQSIAQNNLEAWEPELCVDAYKAMFHCYRKSKNEVISINKADHVFAKICSLDLANSIEMLDK